MSMVFKLLNILEKLEHMVLQATTLGKLWKSKE